MLHHWMRTQRKAKPIRNVKSQQTVKRMRFRPLVELLEDRITPDALSFTQGSGAAFQAGQSWFDTGTTVAVASNGASVSSATINVASTASFLSTGGTIYVQNSAGVAKVTYTGTTATSFTGCSFVSGGNGTLQNTAAIDDVVSQTPMTNITLSGSLPTGTITVASTGAFGTLSNGGTLAVLTSNTGWQEVTYTNGTSTTFTGCSLGQGTLSTTTGLVALIPTTTYSSTATVSTTIASTSAGEVLGYTTTTTSSASLPATTVAVNTTSATTTTGASATAFGTAGAFTVLTGTGLQRVFFTGINGGSNGFTGCTLGTGTYASGAIVTVDSIMTGSNLVTTGFAASGVINVTTTFGVAQVSYTGIASINGGTNNAFIGISGGNGCQLASGASITQATITVAAGGTTDFPTAGTLTIQTAATTVNGTQTPGAGSFTLTVAANSTTNFATAGTLLVNTSNGTELVAYTGKTTGSFTTCTVQSGTTLGTALNGATVSQVTTVTYGGKTANTFTSVSAASGTPLVGGAIYQIPGTTDTAVFTNNLTTNSTNVPVALDTTGGLNVGEIEFSNNTTTAVSPTTYTFNDLSTNPGGLVFNEVYQGSGPRLGGLGVTTLAAGSIPASGTFTLTVAWSANNTIGFPTAGKLEVQTTTGLILVDYTGGGGSDVNPGTFTGCTIDPASTDKAGGTIAAGALVYQVLSTSTTANVSLPADTLAVSSTVGFASSGTLQLQNSTTINGSQNLPAGTITVASTSGFSTTGTNTLYVYTTGGLEVVTYTGTATNSTTFNGTNGQVLSPTTTSSQTLALSASPQSLTVASTSGFTNAPGTFDDTTAGIIVNYTGVTNGTTLAGCTGTGTISSGDLLVGSSTISVASTAGFLSAGSFEITTSAGVQTENYTGISGNTFTGCSGATGTLSSGAAVTQSMFTGCSGGSGTAGDGANVLQETQVTYSGIQATAFTGISGGSGSFSSGTTVVAKNASIYVENGVNGSTGANGVNVGVPGYGPEVFNVALQETQLNATPFSIINDAGWYGLLLNGENIGGVTVALNTFDLGSQTNTDNPDMLFDGTATMVIGGVIQNSPTIVVPSGSGRLGNLGKVGSGTIYLESTNTFTNDNDVTNGQGDGDDGVIILDGIMVADANGAFGPAASNANAQVRVDWGGEVGIDSGVTYSTTNNVFEIAGTGPAGNAGVGQGALVLTNSSISYAGATFSPIVLTGDATIDTADFGTPTSTLSNTGGHTIINANNHFLTINGANGSTGTANPFVTTGNITNYAGLTVGTGTNIVYPNFGIGWTTSGSLTGLNLTAAKTSTALTFGAALTGNTITVGAGQTATYPTSGWLAVATNDGLGTTFVQYTGTSGGNTFTGITGGTGTVASAATLTYVAPSTITANSTLTLSALPTNPWIIFDQGTFVPPTGGSLTIGANDALVLGAGSTLSGITSITVQAGGMLVVDNNLPSTVAITLNQGATLAGTGSIAGTVTLAGGGTGSHIIDPFDPTVSYTLISSTRPTLNLTKAENLDFTANGTTTLFTHITGSSTFIYGQLQVNGTVTVVNGANSAVLVADLSGLTAGGNSATANVITATSITGNLTTGTFLNASQITGTKGVSTTSPTVNVFFTTSIAAVVVQPPGQSNNLVTGSSTPSTVNSSTTSTSTPSTTSTTSPSTTTTTTTTSTTTTNNQGVLDPGPTTVSTPGDPGNELGGDGAFSIDPPPATDFSLAQLAPAPGDIGAFFARTPLRDIGGEASADFPASSVANTTADQPEGVDPALGLALSSLATVGED
jgi:hypothetical protein